jgi:hypothetical protein
MATVDAGLATLTADSTPGADEGACLLVGVASHVGASSGGSSFTAILGGGCWHTGRAEGCGGFAEVGRGTRASGRPTTPRAVAATLSAVDGRAWTRARTGVVTATRALGSTG